MQEIDVIKILKDDPGLLGYITIGALIMKKLIKKYGMSFITWIDIILVSFNWDGPLRYLHFAIPFPGNAVSLFGEFSIALSITEREKRRYLKVLKALTGRLTRADVDRRYVFFNLSKMPHCNKNTIDLFYDFAKDGQHSDAVPVYYYIPEGDHPLKKLRILCAGLEDSSFHLISNKEEAINILLP